MDKNFSRKNFTIEILVWKNFITENYYRKILQ